MTKAKAIPEDELTERFVRASGPGGQNVNKVSTAVELRFDVRNSPSISELARQVLLFGGQLNKDGVLDRLLTDTVAACVKRSRELAGS